MIIGVFLEPCKNMLPFQMTVFMFYESISTINQFNQIKDYLHSISSNRVISLH